MLPVKSAEMIIIGGGVMGASAAYHLASRGMKNIVLLEREQFFGQGATGRCAGGVRHQFGTEINVRLSIESLRMLARFEDEIGQPIDYRKCGYLFVLTKEQDLAAFRKNVEMQRRLGADTRWLSADDVRRRIPAMSFGDAMAGTFNPTDGLVDPNSVVAGYVNAARRMGVELLTSVDVTGIRVGAGRVKGVDTNQGSIDAPLLLNAAGPWSAQIGALAGVSLPVTAIRRQWFTTTPLPDIPADFPFVIDFAQSLYFHREGAGLLVGMSNADQEPGFDQSVDEEFEVVNLEAAVAPAAFARRRWPGLARRRPLRSDSRCPSDHWANIRRGLPCGYRLLGPRLHARPDCRKVDLRTGDRWCLSDA